MEEPLLHTVDEAAALLRISRGRFYSLVAQNKIATVSIGRCRRVERSALEKYVSTIRT